MTDFTSSSPAAQADPPPLDRALMLVAAVVVLGSIMSILDVTVVNVAIGTLANEFNSPLSTIQWVATGYTLALATVIPITGWAADRFGTKRLYILSLSLFTLGSLAAGLAWSAESLIAFRVLQGFGGGMLMPAGMTILTRAAGPQRMGRVMAIIGVPMLLGPILGPILGGYLVDEVSWHWIFFINIPIAALAIVMAFRILPKDEPSTTESFDAMGLALLSPGLALTIYGLAESGSAGGFANASVLVPLLAGLSLIGLFARHALRTINPLIDLRLFKDRTFATAAGTLTLMTTSVFGGFLLIPLYLQVVRGEDAMTSGLLMAPHGLGAMVAMPIAGMLSDKTGIGRIVPGGLALILVTMIGLTQVGADTSYTTYGAILFVQGIGMGFTMMPLFTGALQTLRKSAVARASTTLNIIQQVGASIGTAVLSVILAGALSDRLGGSGGGIESSAGIPDAVRERVAPLMAEAFGSTFWWAVALIIPTLAAATLLPRKKPEPTYDPDTGEIVDEAPVFVHA